MSAEHLSQSVPVSTAPREPDLRRRPPRPADLAPVQVDPLGPLTDLPGVGPARAQALGKLGVTCQRDLLFLVPLGLRDWGRATPLGKVEPGPFVRVSGTVATVRLQRRGRRRSTMRAALTDAGGARVEAVWFNQPWVADVIERGAEVELAGPVKAGKQGPVLQNPRVGRPGEELPAAGTLEPVYPAAEGSAPTRSPAGAKGSRLSVR